MTSQLSTPLHPESLAELLDGRPDTREMISANRSLAEACIQLKDGERDSLEHTLALAKATPSPGIETISACIRAEAVRLSGRESDAWDMAEEIVAKNRFDIVAALYLRFLFPCRKTGVAHRETAALPPIPPVPSPPSELSSPKATEIAAPSEIISSSSEIASSSEIPLPPVVPPLQAPEPSIDTPSVLALHDAPSQSFHDPDSEISIALEHEASEESLPAVQGDLPGVFTKISQDESVRLLRLRNPDGTIAEMLRSSSPIADLDEQILERPSSILASLGFGRLLHASFEGSEGAAHSWQRSGKALFLVVTNTSSAPALAARCSHAMEDQS